ncbi:MAG TPA: outer membrane lipoprotein-sorting protein [Myxococcota bacterium]|nr:outer membrane lipoprotein-sorting protein [Myxococcota bacterium]
MRLALALALACLAGATRSGAAEPAAPELAKRAEAAAFGTDAVEVWKTEWSGEALTFGVARRHENGKFELFLRVFAPHKYEPLSYLFLPDPGGAPLVQYYRSQRIFPLGARTNRTLEVEIASAIERLPFVPGLPALDDLWPRRADRFAFARLADEKADDGTPCRVLESRPREPDGAYDRIVTLLARDSDVALESRFYLGDRLVRRVTVSPSDVEMSDGHSVVKRRTIDPPSGDSQVLTLERFSLDPVFPDQLFTTQNLRAGRFPSY